MQVAYANTQEELILLNLYHASRLWLTRITWVAEAGAMGLAYWAWAPRTPAGPLYYAGLALFVAVTFVFYVLCMIVLLAFRFAPFKRPALYAWRKVALTEQEVIEVLPFDRGRVPWAAVLGVTQNRIFIYIHVSRYHAHFIPKRAFESREQAQQFYEYARARWQAESKRGRALVRIAD